MRPTGPAPTTCTRTVGDKASRAVESDLRSIAPSPESAPGGHAVLGLGRREGALHLRPGVEIRDLVSDEIDRAWHERPFRVDALLRSDGSRKKHATKATLESTPQQMPPASARRPPIPAARALLRVAAPVSLLVRSRVQGRLPVALRKLLKEGEARYKWSAGASRETVISTPSTPFTVRAPQNGAGPTDSMVVSEKVTRQRWSLLPVGKKARMRSGVRSSLSFSEGVNRRPAFVRWTGSPSAAPCERIGPDSRTEQGGWDRAVQTPVPPAASHYACVHGPEPGRPRKPRES